MKVAMHLNDLHFARKAFIKAEASDRIYRVLRHNVRIIDETYQPDDKVFFKCQDSNRWHGPRKVIGQDGKVVFVRNGDQFSQGLLHMSNC